MVQRLDKFCGKLLAKNGKYVLLKIYHYKVVIKCILTSILVELSTILVDKFLFTHSKKVELWIILPLIHIKRWITLGI